MLQGSCAESAHYNNATQSFDQCWFELEIHKATRQAASIIWFVIVYDVWAFHLLAMHLSQNCWLHGAPPEPKHEDVVKCPKKGIRLSRLQLTISQHGTKLASCSHKGKLGGTHIQTQSYDVSPSRNHTKIHQTLTSAGFNWHLYVLVIQRLNLQKSRFLG